MDGEFLRRAALQCLAIARECSEISAKRKLYDMSEEMLRKANEVDGTVAPIKVVRRPANE